MEIKLETEATVLPVLPLRGLVLFPKMTLDFEVGRNISAAALSATVNTNGRIFLVAHLYFKD